MTDLLAGQLQAAGVGFLNIQECLFAATVTDKYKSMCASIQSTFACQLIRTQHKNVSTFKLAPLNNEVEF
jgi:hypothetical protein